MYYLFVYKRVNRHENREQKKKRGQTDRITIETDDCRICKKVLKEWDSDDDFIGHGYKTMSNLGGNEIQISDRGDAARLKFPDGEITDLLEIEFDEEGVAYITTPYGDMERLDEYMRFR